MKKELNLKRLPDVIYAEELAKVLRCNIKTVYSYLQNGTISSFRLGRRYYVSKEALIQYIKKHS